ncbi:hypothetical protein [Stenoxybacter acetivorans]|uniref:hypothetical protein n=1 Tax=Stenoxybacter acetivorans TaxID=422441 RepID=UPI0005661B21|nr:hypothetical protein [Stenoxybacter acetivorans]
MQETLKALANYTKVPLVQQFEWKPYFEGAGKNLLDGFTGTNLPTSGNNADYLKGALKSFAGAARDGQSTGLEYTIPIDVYRDNPWNKKDPYEIASKEELWGGYIAFITTALGQKAANQLNGLRTSYLKGKISRAEYVSRIREAQINNNFYSDNPSYQPIQDSPREHIGMQRQNPTIKTKQIEIYINGEKHIATATGNVPNPVPVFQGVSEADIKEYAARLMKEIGGNGKLPPARDVGKGKIIHTYKNPKTGQSISLRNFSSSADSTGAKWTIDFNRDPVFGLDSKGVGINDEIKFK